MSSQKREVEIASKNGGNNQLLNKMRELVEIKNYQQLIWTGTFEEYLKLVQNDPRLIRNAYQRIYDMILCSGYDEYVDNKEKIIHYKFFDDPCQNGKDAIYGLNQPVMKLVHLFKSAAKSYGTQNRVLLLHGPVGSSKSTIVRLLKKGLEAYSLKDEGALYSYSWKIVDSDGNESWFFSSFG